MSEDSAAAARPRAAMLAALCVCVVLALTPWFSAAAVLPQLRAQWGLSPSMSAWLTISVQLGFVLGAVGSAAANLADRVSSRQLMAVCCLGAGAANLGLLAVPGAWGALGLRLLTGCFLAGVYPPALKLIATWFQAGRGVALGSVIGALTLGSAMPHLANALGGAEWRAVIVAATAATALAAAGMLLVLRDGPYPFPRASFEPGQLRRALLRRPVLLATGGYLGHMWELYAMWSWLLVYAREVLGTEGRAASLLTFFAIAAGAPACVLAGAAADWLGRTRTTIGLMGLSGACAAGIGVSYGGPAWLFVLLSLVWGAAAVADSAQFSAAVTEVADPRYVGTALTAQLGLGFALTAVTIWLLPLLAQELGSWRWVFLALAPGPVLGSLSMAALRRLPEASLLAGGRR